MEKTFVPVDFSKYEKSFSKELLAKFMKGEYLSNEDMRKLMYGYSFTKEFLTDDDNVFSWDYWDALYETIDDDLYGGILSNEDIKDEDFDEKNNIQEHIIPYVKNLIMTTILSTGDGLTPQTAFVVIDVEQEYQLLDFLGIREYTIGQGLLNENGKNIDCLKLTSDNPRNLEQVYFDVSRVFDSGIYSK